jgi:hypothetical protein
MHHNARDVASSVEVELPAWRYERDSPFEIVQHENRNVRHRRDDSSPVNDQIFRAVSTQEPDTLARASTLLSASKGFLLGDPHTAPTMNGAELERFTRDLVEMRGRCSILLQLMSHMLKQLDPQPVEFHLCRQQDQCIFTMSTPEWDETLRIFDSSDIPSPQ